MNRRSSLGMLLGRKKASKQTKSMPPPISFAPYAGPWEYEHAAHLLRRTVFGPTKAQIDASVTGGLAASINFLFQPQPIADPPIYFRFEDDPLAPLGSTWIDEIETPNIDGLRGSRKASLNAWQFLNMQKGGANIRQKMLLFWHNHFVVINPNTGRRRYQYLQKLYNNTTGNFRTLLEEMTIDPAMLVFLNGTQNSANGPNENYARELLELFALGKGPAAGPGDYTTFTEDDVVSIARALTGWRAFDANNNNDPAYSSYNSNRHDTGEKQLSHRFNDAVITNAEENEYKIVIQLILQKDECARFISRKLIRWFVHSDITAEVEANVVEPMAQMIIADNYELENAIKALLSSQYFYDESIRGCMIAHSLDYLFKLMNSFEVATPTELINSYEVAKNFHSAMDSSDMAIWRHPTVAGWKAFYKAPQYDKFWISAVTLPQRETLADRFMNGYNTNGWRVEIDVIAFAASLDNPTDPNSLITEAAAIIFPQPLSDEQITALKEILIPGLPDFEWTVEYGEFINGNDDLAEAIEDKLKSLFGTMIKMPEFHLI